MNVTQNLTGYLFRLNSLYKYFQTQCTDVGGHVEGFVLTVTYSNGSNISPHRAPLRTFQSYQKPENNGRKLRLDRVSYALLWAHGDIRQLIILNAEQSFHKNPLYIRPAFAKR